MGSHNNTMNATGADLFIPYCTREPCHLDSQGASLFLDDSEQYSKLTVDTAYVTGGGITHPILNAGVCIEDMINAGYNTECEQSNGHWNCTSAGLMNFAEFLASDFFNDQQSSNDCYQKNIDYRQTTFLNSITSALYAELMGFKSMTVLSDGPDSWDHTYDGLVLSFSSTKVELFNETSDLAKASYPDSDCRNTGIYYILDEQCIKGTMKALKDDYDSNDSRVDPVCDNTELSVVASAGARNDIKGFLSSTKELNFFTDVFSSVCSEVSGFKLVEVVSGEKEAFLGMEKMLEALNNNTIDIGNENTGYLDFGGNSVQPSFWLRNNHHTIFPSELNTEVKLNSFLNYGADAVKYRVSQMYLVFTKYQGVCDIGPKLNINMCYELIEFISLGGDHVYYPDF